jgi:hypothetical protein
MLSPGPSVRRLRGKKGKRQTRFSQPADIREGVANAYTLMKEVCVHYFMLFLLLY